MSRFLHLLLVTVFATTFVFEERQSLAQEIKISSPTADSEVGHTELVRGKLSEPQFHVYVLVHPLLTDLWWVQRRPTPPNPDGSWQSIAYFGTKGKGINEFFELVAIANPNANEFKEGQTLSDQQMIDILARYPRTPSIVVKRTR